MTSAHGTRGYALVVTALRIEREAVRRHLTGIRESVVGGSVHDVGVFAGEARDWEVTIVQTGPHNVPAALEVERAIRAARPSVALFVGVAGGLKDVEVGDVVASTVVYGYESGKQTAAFLPRPDVYRASHALIQRARAEAGADAWKARAGKSALGRSAFVEPIAAGEKVVAETRSAIRRFLRRQYGDALAIEMEGLGFLAAVHANQQVQGIVVRGISDLLDHKAAADAGGSQERAARNAAAFAFQILHRLEGDRPLPPERAEEGDKDALAIVQSATRRAAERLEHGLGGIVLGQNGDAPFSLEAIADELLSGRHLVFTGGSGSGKTHLARHACGAAAARGALVVFARAKRFSESTLGWLDDAVAPLCDVGATTLIALARRECRPVILVVDGLNECPGERLSELIDGIEATVVRSGCTTLLTTSGTEQLSVSSRTVGVGEYSDPQRMAIFALHGGEASGQLAGLTSLRTPFELAMMAAAQRATSDDASPYDHLHGYATKALAADGRHILWRAACSLATLLHEQVRFAVPLRVAHAEVGRALGLDDGATLVSELARSKLVEVDAGYVSFAHEQLLRFFGAEAIVAARQSADETANHIDRPRWQPVAPFVLQARAHWPDAGELLLRSEAARALFHAILRSALGPALQRVLLVEMERVADRAVQALGRSTATLAEAGGTREWRAWDPNGDVLPPRRRALEVRCQEPCTWTDTERALFLALGHSANWSRCRRAALRLIEATDAWVKTQASARDGQIAIWNFLYLGLRRDALPASLVLWGARRWEGPDAERTDEHLAILRDADPDSPGSLCLVFRLLHRHSHRLEKADAEHQAAASASELLTATIAAWELGAAAVRCDALDLFHDIHHAGSVDTKRAAVDWVARLDSQGDFATEAHLFDLLGELGILTSPTTASDITHQVRAVLMAPSDPDARKAAAGIFSSQFERIVGSAHFEAIAGLSAADRLQLHSLAALGDDLGTSTAEYALFDVILSPGLLTEPLARQAVEHWSDPPTEDSLRMGGGTGPFALAALGRAALALEPRSTPPNGSPTALAWLATGEVIYWSAVPNLGRAERAANAAPAWRSLQRNAAHAATVMSRVVTWSKGGDHREIARCANLVQWWPDDSLAVLGAAARDFLQLITVADRRDVDVTHFVARNIVALAGAEARAALGHWVDIPGIGHEVVRLLGERATC